MNSELSDVQAGFRKRKEAKWLFEKALQIAKKRREAKGKRVKERYIQWMLAI